MEVLRPQSYLVENVGRWFKHSKRKISWKIQVGAETYDIGIFMSRYTSKIRVFVNNEKQVDTIHYGKYQSRHQLRLGAVQATVVQINDRDFDLLINKKSMMDALHNDVSEVYSDNTGLLSKQHSHSICEHDLHPLSTDLLGIW